MEFNNLYQICVFFCVGLMVFTLSVNFVVGLGVFGDISLEGGMDVDNKTSDEIVGNFTKSPGSELGFGGIWGIVLGLSTFIAAGGAVAIAIATQNATFVGVYVFSIYFWASYLNTLGILGLGGFIGADILLLFTIPVGFVFMGAIVGMLSGV